MSPKNLKKTAETKKIEKLLSEHFPDCPPEYPPQAYRYNSASIRLRVVSPRFSGLNRVEREKIVFPILRTLPEDTWLDITVALLLAPEDVAKSPMNREFESPTPSRL
jgi:stress-induced morphogen